MSEKVLHEVRFIETDDGFRIEIKGDKEKIRKMGFGPGMMMGFGPGLRREHRRGHGRDHHRSRHHHSRHHHHHEHGAHGYGRRGWGWWWDDEAEVEDTGFEMNEKSPEDI